MLVSRSGLARLLAFEAVAAVGLAGLARPLAVGAALDGRAFWLHAPTGDLAAVGGWWVASALAAWTVVTTAAGVAAQAVPALRAFEPVTAPFVRRAVACAFAASVLVRGAPAAPAAPSTTRTRTSSTAPATTTTVPPVVRVAPDGEIVVEPRERPRPSPRPGASMVQHMAAPSTPVRRHVVRTGENLWVIAAAHLAHPSDREVLPYWRRLVARNRATLRSGDPDLVYPGERLELPPV